MTVYNSPPLYVGLTLNGGDTLFVNSRGASILTTINGGGLEVIASGGGAIETIINKSGLLMVDDGGIAKDVTFGTPGGVLELENPLGLTGTIKDWFIGDVIDLLHTQVTAVSQTQERTQFTVLDKVTVTYDNNQKVTYTLLDKHPGLQVTFHSDGHGGTDLVLTPVVGVPHQDDHGHHFFS